MLLVIEQDYCTVWILTLKESLKLETLLLPTTFCHTPRWDWRILVVFETRIPAAIQNVQMNGKNAVLAANDVADHC